MRRWASALAPNQLLPLRSNSDGYVLLLYFSVLLTFCISLVKPPLPSTCRHANISIIGLVG